MEDAIEVAQIYHKFDYPFFVYEKVGNCPLAQCQPLFHSCPEDRYGSLPTECRHSNVWLLLDEYLLPFCSSFLYGNTIARFIKKMRESFHKVNPFPLALEELQL